MEGASLHASLIGATIGNYRVVAKLGEGGMGSVYLAEHPLIGKKVALKVLHEEYAANQDVVTRFFNEAKAVNDIGHPNIVDVIDYGVVQQQAGPGFVYFIMEFLAGESLAQIIQRDAPLPPERALYISMQVADALAASHAKGIVHRDLKPDNIYLMQRARERDFVKVLDFGIAKLTSNDAGSRRTRTGIVMGTPAYMSPEQCEGRGNIDHRTDIYALGILIYEMITGRVPFAGEGYGEVLVQHLTKAPARPSTVRGVIPPAVEAIVMKALEKKPDHRYQTMEQFIAAMRDPVGYVNAAGGPDAFLQQPGAPGPNMPTLALQPGSMDMPLPGPGYPSQPGNAYQSQPGLYAAQLPVGLPPRPTTLTHGSGEMAAAPGRRVPVVAISVVLGLAILGGVGFLVFGNKKPTETAQIDDKKPETPDNTVKPADNTVKPADNTVKPADNTKATVQPTDTTKPADNTVKPADNTVKPADNTVKPADTTKPADQVPVPDTKPKTVKVHVSSVPPGAEVFVGNETTARGKTPLDLTLPRAEGDADLTLKLGGYKVRSKKVKTSEDADLEVALDKDQKLVQRPVDVVKKPADVKKPPVDVKKPDVKKVDDDDVMAPTSF